ncbi:MAG: lysophospholipid acyltransferase family protein [Acidimicrobiales bacterium]
MGDRAALRRTLSIFAVTLGIPLWIGLAPVWIVVALVVDALGGLKRLPTLRLCVYLLVYLFYELIGTISATWLWLAGSAGRSLNLSQHRAVQGWWATGLIRWGGHLLGIRLDLDDPTTLPPDTFILLSRHASMVDAVIPAAVITGQLQRYVHYVIKRELRWDPSIDLFGTRLGNHFVARGQETEIEEQAIAELGEQAQPDSALVIFPEGTYSTPQTRRRVLDSLKRRGDRSLVERAEALQALLPPKPAGTLALLSSQPDADVVVVGHVGLEGVAELPGLRRRLPLTSPVTVRWWTHRRSELPSTDDGLTEWLGERWLELDRWVVETRNSG